MTFQNGYRWVVCVAAFGVCLWTAGCGMPGAPMPPSLKLPELVTNLTAVRTGNEVALQWTMPKRTTDKVLIREKDKTVVRVCLDSENGCVAINAVFRFGGEARYTVVLPAGLSLGEPQKHAYFVEIENEKGHSAGLSNAAVIVSGTAPQEVAGFVAEVQKQGVVVHWAGGDSKDSVRLYRKLLTPHKAAPKSSQPFASSPTEPVEGSLLISSAHSGKALDKTARLGEAYEYRAQFARFVKDGNKTFELAGPISAPVRVEVQDIFPPAVPTGLVAVAMEAPGSGVAVDLNWQPVADANLAGYVVYRREGDAAWACISQGRRLVEPAFHDATVQVGHAYRYAVSSIGENGHESVKSEAAEESVPTP